MVVLFANTCFVFSWQFCPQIPLLNADFLTEALLNAELLIGTSSIREIGVQSIGANNMSQIKALTTCSMCV